MGEIIIACFIGVWLALAGVFGYKQIKKEYKDIEKKEGIDR